MIERRRRTAERRNPRRGRAWKSVSKPVAKPPMSSKESERKKRELITIGRAKGFLTYDEVNDHMPESIVSSDQIDDWLSTLGGEGIEIVDSASQVRVADKSGGAEAEEGRVTPEPVRPAEPGGGGRGRRLLQDQRSRAHVSAQDGVGIPAHPRR